MAVVLGALIFGLLAGGLSLLMAIPLLFAILGIGVFKEWQVLRHEPAAPSADALRMMEPPAAERERPRTMTAGARR